MADGSGGVLERLMRTTKPEEQAPLREALAADGRVDDLRTAYLTNPFLQLSNAEAARLAAEAEPAGLGGLIAARHAAMTSIAPRYAVFCMPKSGSSFVRSAIAEALQAPVVSLTAVGPAAAASYFGMNGREQEIDEFALVKAILSSPSGFVAQHHTRYTQYLGLQMRAYGVTPILTVRNVFDCLVSFDEMMLDWRAGKPEPYAWISDPYALPRDYPRRPAAERFSLLANSLGVWLVQFMVSWKRGLRQQLLSPLVIRYESDILNQARFVERVSTRLGLSGEQRARLAAYAAAPDRKRSRFNVGRAGRGRERVPEATRRFLADYAASFADEISAEELRELVG